MPPSVQANASLKETIMKDHRCGPSPRCMCFAWPLILRRKFLGSGDAMERNAPTFLLTLARRRDHAGRLGAPSSSTSSATGPLR
jgi:hypothetical protein